MHIAYTGRIGWMTHRKWKEAKQLPGTAGPGNMHGCCLIYFHFLWAILPIRPGHESHHIQNVQFSKGDKIQVSPQTKLFLDMSGGFRCEDRGFVDIKGKGSLQTFYVLSKVN